MSKAWCIWCESGNGRPNDDFFWLHEDCFYKITDIMDDVKQVKKMLDEHKSIDEIARFLERGEDFVRKWNNTSKIIKSFAKK